MAIEENDILMIIIEKIEKSEGYKEDLALTQIRYIAKDREEQKERVEKQRERDFQLERLRLTQNADIRSSTS